MKILVIEDDSALSEVLRQGLTAEGYEVEVSADGIQGERQALTNRHDLLILDWMLPGQDGITLVKRLRARGDSRPMIVLTALANVPSRALGLEAEADHYLAKPFSFAGLLPAIRRLQMREAGKTDERHRKAGPIEIDTVRQQATVARRPLDLRPKEYALLAFFVENPRRVLPRALIAETVWGTSSTSDDVINMTVSSLRQKLRASGSDQPVAIATMRGVGYRLEIPLASM
jgi:DNA-binding response OmpR family regulator